MISNKLITSGKSLVFPAAAYMAFFMPLRQDNSTCPSPKNDVVDIRALHGAPTTTVLKSEVINDGDLKPEVTGVDQSTPEIIAAKKLIQRKIDLDYQFNTGTLPLESYLSGMRTILSDISPTNRWIQGYLAMDEELSKHIPSVDGTFFRHVEDHKLEADYALATIEYFHKQGILDDQDLNTFREVAKKPEIFEHLLLQKSLLKFAKYLPVIKNAYEQGLIDDQSLNEFYYPRYFNFITSYFKEPNELAQFFIHMKNSNAQQYSPDKIDAPIDLNLGDVRSFLGSLQKQKIISAPMYMWLLAQNLELEDRYGSSSEKQALSFHRTYGLTNIFNSLYKAGKLDTEKMEAQGFIHSLESLSAAIAVTGSKPNQQKDLSQQIAEVGEIYKQIFSGLYTPLNMPDSFAQSR